MHRKSSANLVIGPDPNIYENTPVFSKISGVVIQQGVVAGVQWQLQDRDGFPIDLRPLFPDKDDTPVDRSKRSPCDDVWDIIEEYGEEEELEDTPEEELDDLELDSDEYEDIEEEEDDLDVTPDIETDDPEVTPPLTPVPTPEPTPDPTPEPTNEPEDTDEPENTPEVTPENPEDTDEPPDTDVPDLDSEIVTPDETGEPEESKEPSVSEVPELTPSTEPSRRRRRRRRFRRRRETFFIEVRIQAADEPREPMWVVPAIVRLPRNGSIRFTIPDQISAYGGIYVMNIGICRSSDRRPIYIQRGLLCVERSAWRDPTVDCKMPTLSEIRMRIMDTDVENLLQGYVEFTTSDILDSIVSAVREWNGTAPQLARHTYTCYTFPWIEPWLNKIVASLYNKAALRYARNKLMVSHGGIQGDDLARDEVYKAIAAQYEKEWKEWMLVKKKALNLEQFSGTVSSPYWQTVNSQRGKLGW